MWLSGIVSFVEGKWRSVLPSAERDPVAIMGPDLSPRWKVSWWFGPAVQ
jgi:hypothetical protein